MFSLNEGFCPCSSAAYLNSFEAIENVKCFGCSTMRMRLLLYVFEDIVPKNATRVKERSVFEMERKSINVAFSMQTDTIKTRHRKRQKQFSRERK